MTRDEAEREMAEVIQRALWAQKKRVLKNPDWLWEDWLLAADLEPLIEMIAMQEALRLYKDLRPMRQLGGIWDRIKAWAAGWVRSLAHDINRTSWKMLDEVLQKYMMEGWTWGEFEAQVADIFGVDRATRIAVTETTRAYVEGNRAAADELAAEGLLPMIEIWRVEDEAACDDCKWLDGEPRGAAWDRGMGPPLHPNCRCQTVFEIA